MSAENDDNEHVHEHQYEEEHEEEEGEGVGGVAEAEEPRPWVGQDPRARHEHEHEHGHEHDRAAAEGPPRRPGSEGERLLQRRLGTSDRAERFYDEQVLDHLNDHMREFVQRQEMFFLATADASGECDSSFRAGPAGFLQVLGKRSLAYPEYRGNGVHASLGNIEENPHLGIMLIDFTRARIGLHINGRATVLHDEEIRASYPDLPEDPVPGRRAQMWVLVEVEEAYIHCAKHIPQMQKAPRRTARDWGTDDYKRKGGDFFGTARDSREGVGVGADVDGAAREHAVPSEPAVPSERVIPSERAVPSEPAVGEGLGHAEESGAGALSASSAYDELLGYAREDGHAELDTAFAGDSTDVPEARLPGQRRSPDLQWPELPPPPRFPTASFNSHEQAGPTAMDGASGALAARGAPSAGFQMPGSDPRVWRQEAERALEEAQRRGAVSERGSFQGWFG